MVFRLKIGLFSAYLSVVVVVVVVVVEGQPKQRKPPETHFPKSQTSTANRRSYMKLSFRVKIRMARWLSPKCRTLAVPVSLVQTM